MQDIDATTWERLRAHAAASGQSVDDLLNDWLDQAARYRSLFEQLNDAIYLITTDGLCFDVNQAGLDLLGYRRDEMQGFPHTLAVAPEERDASLEMLQRLVAGEQLPPYERVLMRKDGTTLIAELNVGLVYDEDGSVLYVQSIARDITERKEMEARLQQSEEQLRWLIQNMPVMVDAFDQDNRLIAWNAECERVTGYTAEELIGNPDAMAILYPDSAYRQFVLDDAPIDAPGFRDREYTLTCKDGSQRIISWANISRHHPIPGWHVWAIGVDVTEQRRTEQALRQSEERYRTLVENAYEGIYIAHDNPFPFRFVSHPMTTITGYSRDELLAMDMERAAALIHPDDRERDKQHFLYCLNEMPVPRNDHYRMIHRSGAIRHIDVYRVRIDYEGAPAVQTVVLDVTDQVEVQRLTTRFQKEQARNSLIQRIIAMFSHDMRTPLAIIQSSRDLLDRYFDRLSDDDRQEKLDTIARQVQFAQRMLDDAVHTARGNLSEREFNPVAIQLATLCQVSVDEIRATYDGPHTLLFINRTGVETVAVDEVLVSRILINLLSNAVKYSPDGGEIRLELDAAGDSVVLRVIDHGIGIAPEDLPHIFDPFYRAKGVRDILGSGLGLSIVMDCVERHHGDISVESTPGQGSTFMVTLPVALPHPPPYHGEGE